MKSRGFGRLASVWALILVCALLTGCGSGGSSTRSSSAGSSRSTTITIPAPRGSSAAASTGETTEPAEEAEAEEEPVEEGPQFAGFPEVGETVEGFTLLEVRDFEIMGAEVGWFSHEDSGAKLMYIHNDDTNRAFDLTFLTHSINNEGLPHVFEHATLGGSKKYPSKTLFFNLMYQTYNTFMNAMTYDRMTTYPVASLSEAQLLALADYYTDSCFYPMIMEDESIYRTEAWRYRLESEEDDLTMEGTVYSEMLGATTKQTQANLNAIRASLPGTSITYSFGGDPKDIPDMTWQELKDYHDTFYTPDNCVAFLYGDIVEYEKFLALLNEVFTNFGKEDAEAEVEDAADAEASDAADEASTDAADEASTDVADEATTEDATDAASTADSTDTATTDDAGTGATDNAGTGATGADDEETTSDASTAETSDASPEDSTDTASTETPAEEEPEEEAEPWFVEEDYERITESVVEEVPFAVEEGTPTENAAIVYYNFVGSAFEEEESLPLQMFGVLMAQDASPLTQTLKQEFPSGVATCGVEIAGPDLLPMFSIENVNREDAEKYQEIVNDALADIAENGLPEELIDGVMATQSLTNRLLREDESAGVNVIATLAYYYAITGNPWEMMAQYDAVEKLSEWNTDGTFKAIAEKLLDEEQTPTTLVTTYPEPGLKEKEDAELAAELAKIKAGMSKEEIATLIEESRTFDAGEEEAAEEETDATDEASTEDSADTASTEDNADTGATGATDKASTEDSADTASTGTSDATDTASTEDSADTASTEDSADAATTEEAPAEEEIDDATAQMLAQLKVVEVADLPEEAREYEIRDEMREEEEVRYLEAVAGVDGVGFVTLMIDAQSFATEEIHDFMLFRNLTAYLETENLSRAEIDTQMARYTYNPQIAVSNLRTEEGGAHPYLQMGWIANTKDLEAGYDLMRQLIFELDFSDPEKLSNAVQAVYTQKRNEYNQSPVGQQLNRGYATFDEQARFMSYLAGVDYYAYLAELQDMFAAEDEEGIKDLTERLVTVQEKLRNRYGFIVCFAGSEADIETNRALADAFMESMEYEETEAAAYDLPVPKNKEAMIAESGVQYNMIVAGYEDMGLEDGYTADLGVVAQIVDDRILLPELRDRYGAYGAFNVFEEDTGVFIYTYRDPNVKESFDVYATVADKLRGMELTQEEVDGYIMSAYVGYAKPAGELTGAMTALNNHLKGKSTEKTLEYMRQAKSVTPERVKELADIYDRILEAGRMSTSGTAAKINANEDLYEEILNPFGAASGEETNLEFTDVPEDHEFYEAVQTVVGMGFMEPLEEDVFGVDEPATVGEFAYVMMAGMSDAETALGMFQQMGFLSGLKAEDELTKEATLETLKAMLALQPAAAAEAPDLESYPLSDTVTRGELAYLAVAE